MAFFRIILVLSDQTSTQCFDMNCFLSVMMCHWNSHDIWHFAWAHAWIFCRPWIKIVVIYISSWLGVMLQNSHKWMFGFILRTKFNFQLWLKAIWKELKRNSHLNPKSPTKPFCCANRSQEQALKEMSEKNLFFWILEFFWNSNSVKNSIQWET